MKEFFELFSPFFAKEHTIVLLCSAVLFFLLKKKGSELNFINKSQASIIKANEDFREEIKKDLEAVKKEKNELIKKLEFLEEKLFHLGLENMALKKREVELTQEIHDLKKKISSMGGDCTIDNCDKLRECKAKIEEYEKEISILRSEKYN